MTLEQKVQFCIESNFILGNNDSGFEYMNEQKLDEYIDWYNSIFADDELN